MVSLNTVFRTLIEAEAQDFTLGYKGGFSGRSVNGALVKRHYWDIVHRKHGIIGSIMSSQRDDTLDVNSITLHRHPSTGQDLRTFSAKAAMANTLGPSVVRKFVQQIKQTVPTVKRIGSTSRYSGVRRYSGSRDVKPLLVGKPKFVYEIAIYDPYDKVGASVEPHHEAHAHKLLSDKISRLHTAKHVNLDNEQYLGVVRDFAPHLSDHTVGEVPVYYKHGMTSAGTCTTRPGSNSRVMAIHLSKHAVAGRGSGRSLGGSFFHEVEHAIDHEHGRPTSEFTPRLRQFLRTPGSRFPGGYDMLPPERSFAKQAAGRPADSWIESQDLKPYFESIPAGKRKFPSGLEEPKEPKKEVHHTCDCEHHTHFGGTYHEYGAKHPETMKLQTIHGKMRICQGCYDDGHVVEHPRRREMSLTAIDDPQARKAVGWKVKGQQVRKIRQGERLLDPATRQERGTVLSRNVRLYQDAFGAKRYVRYHKGTPVSAVRVQVGLPDASWALIKDSYTHPEHRNKGYVKELLKHVHAHHSDTSYASDFGEMKVSVNTIFSQLLEGAVRAAAFRVGGKVYTGPTHAAVFAQYFGATLPSNAEEGFVTHSDKCGVHSGGDCTCSPSDGKFVDRKAAALIAKKFGQVPQSRPTDFAGLHTGEVLRDKLYVGEGEAIR